MRVTRPFVTAACAAVLALVAPMAAADGISSIYGGDEAGAAGQRVGSLSRGFTPFVGALHEHSGYSDGWVGSTPATYFASGKKLGLDFMGSGDHSDFLSVPISTSEYCLTEPGPACVVPDPDPVKSLTKWDATKKYAAAATTSRYGAFQGFEWSSDIYGHINVYFSKNLANGKLDGYPTPKTFYDWLSRRPEAGGGSDGIATFNHPGAKDLIGPVREGLGLPDETSLNWNDFAYDPRVDSQMAGIEVYNDDDDFSSYFARALDKGWHVAPVGAEDLGHRRSDQWGGRKWPKTIILATDRSPAALKAAMLARRVYAVRDGAIRIELAVNGQMMGSRITAPTGRRLPIKASVRWPGHKNLTLQLVTSKGKVVASGKDQLAVSRAAAPGEKYYFLRVLDRNSNVGYSAPVWVSAAKNAHLGEWLAGDLHVHTCYSHDSYCPRGQKGSYFDDAIGTPFDPQFKQIGDAAGPSLDEHGLGDGNTDITGFYTLSGTVRERFAEASVKGLDYLAITDHHSDGSKEPSGSLSVRDKGFGTSEVIGVPAYENSISGHAQMLGATRVYPAGKKDAASINRMATALRADGGLFQANHPVDGLDRKLTSCRDISGIQWGYGFNVRVDSVEVWNLGHYLQPPLPSSLSNDDSEFYWECMLNKGWRVAATGGSDSHWMSTVAVQGLGNPTTWVFARERSARGVLAAIREGRTSISLTPPLLGQTQLLLEADVDGDGSYESMIGDTVPPGTRMRVRALGTPGAGLVEVRANGASLLTDAVLRPGGSVDFVAPAKAGWVRAKLYAPDALAQRTASCDQPLNELLDVFGQQTSYCRNQVLTVAKTSAIYLGRP